MQQILLLSKLRPSMYHHRINLQSANAGLDQIVNAGDKVILYGSGSKNPDGDYNILLLETV